MRRYRTGAHAKYDLKVHVVWVPKYRKRVLTGPVAVRVRDLLRQIATENDLHIIFGQGGDRPRAHVPELSGAPEHQPDRAVAQGHKLARPVPGVPASQEAVLGPTPVGAGVFRCHIWHHH
jgi:transposase IS200 family protein